MVVNLSEEHRAFEATCVRFVERQLLPLVAEAELEGTFPPALWKELATAGLLGLRIPEDYGGSDADCVAVTILATELSKASGGLAITPLVSSYMAATHIGRYGNEIQKGSVLPGVAAGETVAAIAVTEP